MSIPDVDHTDIVNLVGTSASPTACAASGAYVSSGVYGASTTGALDSLKHRTLWLNCVYTAGTGGTTGAAGLIVLFSAAAAKPAATAASFQPLMVSDGSVTSTTLGGNLPASTPFTKTPNWGAVQMRRALFLVDSTAVKATNDVDGGTIPIICPHAYWFQVLYAEHGHVAQPGSVWISYSLST